MFTPSVYVFRPTSNVFTPSLKVNELSASVFKFVEMVLLPSCDFSSPSFNFPDPSAACAKPLPVSLILSK
ncbi:hypothetical protein NT05LI_2852, partial [Listeria ivanovii FSL F6-596]